MTIKELRKETGLTQAEFGKLCYGIPARTIQNWEEEKRKCPEYLLKLIEYKIKTAL